MNDFALCLWSCTWTMIFPMLNTPWISTTFHLDLVKPNILIIELSWKLNKRSFMDQTRSQKKEETHFTTQKPSLFPVPITLLLCPWCMVCADGFSVSSHVACSGCMKIQLYVVHILWWIFHIYHLHHSNCHTPSICFTNIAWTWS